MKIQIPNNRRDLKQHLHDPLFANFLRKNLVKPSDIPLCARSLRWGYLASPLPGFGIGLTMHPTGEERRDERARAL